MFGVSQKNFGRKIFKYSGILLIILGSFACEPVGTNGSSRNPTMIEQTIAVEAGKANFLVLTNVGTSSKGSISVNRQVSGAWYEEAPPSSGKRLSQHIQEELKAELKAEL
ncbi:MAG: hypothetical protein AAF975_06560, partial [Spirochaetota bacterium]